MKFINYVLVNIPDLVHRLDTSTPVCSRPLQQKLTTLLHIPDTFPRRPTAKTQNEPTQVFGVTFRTPPEDSTGVPHILEHSVLCGSRKFPLKEPFADLLKGSLQTFLNAFTYPDRTCYPVASQNLKVICSSRLNANAVLQNCLLNNTLNFLR